MHNPKTNNLSDLDNAKVTRTRPMHVFVNKFNRNTVNINTLEIYQKWVLNFVSGVRKATQVDPAQLVSISPSSLPARIFNSSLFLTLLIRSFTMQIDDVTCLLASDFDGWANCSWNYHFVPKVSRRIGEFTKFHSLI